MQAGACLSDTGGMPADGPASPAASLCRGLAVFYSAQYSLSEPAVSSSGSSAPRVGAAGDTRADSHAAGATPEGVLERRAAAAHALKALLASSGYGRE